MIESSDDLRTVIREHGATDPDPASVAEKILASLTDTEAHVIARLALPEYVRHVLAAPRPDTGAAPTFENPDGQRFASPKIANLHGWMDAQLRRSVAGVSEYKALGQCTAADCAHAAATRRRKAAETIAEAQRFERLATAIRAAAVDLVEQLDRAVLAEILAR